MSDNNGIEAAMIIAAATLAAATPKGSSSLVIETSSAFREALTAVKQGYKSYYVSNPGN